MPTLSLLYNIALEFSVTAIRKEKGVKHIQIGNEEINLCLIMSFNKWKPLRLYTHTYTLFKLINKFSDVAGYKLVVFLHTSKEQTKKEIKKTISFAVASKE